MNKDYSAKSLRKFSHTYLHKASTQLALCTAALLPAVHELQPAPCFLTAIIGQT